MAFNWFLKPWPRVWRLFLLAASYYFYYVWGWRLLISLIGLSFLSYWVGRAIFYNVGGKKKTFLVLGVICNLAVLVFFKYYDFFRLSAETILGKLGLAVNLPLLELVLAVGLSFYLFKIISFLADCYSGKAKEYPSLLDFSLYVAFFPQLLSGPIARADEFLPQLVGGGAKKIEDIHYYTTLLMVGFFKKLLIVNYLTANITDDVFTVPQNHGSLVILLAVLAYALVIYLDLSSYSDMAIGFAGFLGFRTPANFDAPYASRTIQDFWRRWHITLSNWVRDYIYIPLGGSRHGRLRQYASLIVAMTAMGFWHGASGHFIFWGFLQGAALSVNSVFLNFKKTLALTVPAALGRIGNFFSWLLTFLFVIFGWIFFRVESVGDGFAMINQLFSFQNLNEAFRLYVLLAIIIGFVFVAFEKPLISAMTAVQRRMPLAVWVLVVAAAVALLYRAGSDTLPDFIYFNF